MSINLLRYAQGENISDTLSSSIGSSDTSIPVNTISKWSSSGGNVIIDRGTSSQEIIVITGVSGSSLVVASGGRGFDGTTAVGHNSGATIESVPFAKDWNDLISALLNLLVIAGTLDTTKVVDLTTAQTLTNKTLTSPVLNTGVSGTAIDTDGTLAANSDTKLASQKAVKTYVDTNAPRTDGWLSDSHTWTYASASTFTIAGVDLTAVFTKGTRLKFTQTTTKYAVVVSSSFSTNTTVTIAVNTDYTIANAAITSPFYSYAANPQGYPGWFNFTTTFGGFSANPASPVAKFAVIGTTCYLKFSMPNSGTSNGTSLTLTTPITSASDSGDQSLFGTGVVDNGTNIAHTGPCVLPANSTTITCYTSENFGTWTASSTKRIAYIQGFYPI